MQHVRIIKNDGFETVYQDLPVSIHFDKQSVELWNGVYWETIPFADIKLIATWEE